MSVGQKSLSSQEWQLFVLAAAVTSANSFILFALGWQTDPADLIASAQKLAVPAAMATAVLFLHVGLTKIDHRIAAAIPYALFFSISVTSLLGLTKTLTGSHAQSLNIMFWGLSFYSAYLAFALKTGKISLSSIPRAANPALLISGPIPVVFRSIRTSRLRRRALYFGPFMVIGVFFFGVIAFQLSRFLWMIELTAPGPALAFAAIFELFVYFNFAGISLIMYALFGLAGVRIPLNFRQPFSSRNLIEFWQGWHTSLSVVLKSLFYLPVRKKAGTAAAVMVVFLSSAFWHGVTLNFLMWGLFHGGAFVFTIWLLKQRRTFAAAILLLPTVIFGRLLFADSETVRLLAKLSFDASYGPTEFQTVHDEGWIGLGIAVILVASEFLFARKRLFRRRTYKYLRTPPAVVVLVIMTVLFIHSSGGSVYAVYGQR